jgi:hypothetical protein
MESSFDATFEKIMAPQVRHRVPSWDLERFLEWDRELWSYIITHGEKHHSAKKVNMNAACIVAFTSSRSLPTDVVGVIADCIKTPVKDATIARVSKFCNKIPSTKLGRYGRGGEGLAFNLKYRNPKLWLHKYQHPRLPFSQPEFCKEIREKAHIALFRRLQLSGTVASQLQSFLIALHYKY